MVQVELFLYVEDRLTLKEVATHAVRNNLHAIEIINSEPRHKSANGKPSKRQWVFDYYAKLTLLENGLAGDAAFVHIASHMNPARNVYNGLADDLLKLPEILQTSGTVNLTANAKDLVKLTTFHKVGKASTRAMNHIRLQEINGYDKTLTGYRFDKIKEFSFNVGDKPVSLYSGPTEPGQKVRLYNLDFVDKEKRPGIEPGQTVIDGFTFRKMQRDDSSKFIVAGNQGLNRSFSLDEPRHYFGAAPGAYAAWRRENDKKRADKKTAAEGDNSTLTHLK